MLIYFAELLCSDTTVFTKALPFNDANYTLLTISYIAFVKVVPVRF